MNHFASWPRPQRFTAGNTIKTIETNHWFCITTLPQRFTAGITVSQSNQSHSGGNHRFCITTTPTKGPQPTTPITKVPAEITDTVSRPRPQRFTPAATWPSAFTTNHIQAEITDSAEGDTATPSKVHGTREGEKKCSHSRWETVCMDTYIILTCASVFANAYKRILNFSFSYSSSLLLFWCNLLTSVVSWINIRSV